MTRKSSFIRRSDGRSKATLRVFIVLVLIACFAAANPANVEAGMKYEVPDPAKYEGFPAVVLHKNRTHEITFGYAGFETKIKEERVVMVITPEGAEEYGTFQTPYYVKNSEIKVKARVIRPDGKKIDIKRDDVHETRIGERWRRKTIVFPGLSPGSVIEIETERKESDSFMSNGHYSMGEKIPVVKASLEYKVPVPCEAAFAFVPFRAGKRYIKGKNDGSNNTYRIEKRDLPPYHVEPYMPAEYRNAPTVSYMVETRPKYIMVNYKGEESLSDEIETVSWASYCERVKGYYYMGLIGDDGEGQGYRQAVREYLQQMGIPDETQDDIERINLILEHFQENFEIVGEMLDIDSPAECLEDRKGTRFSVSYVLRSVLEEAGYKTTPVFVVDVADGEFDERVIGFEQFTDVLLIVDTRKRRHWVAASEPNARLDDIPWNYQGITGLALYERIRPAFVETPLWVANTNEVRRTVDAVLTEDGTLEGTLEMALTGTYYLRYCDLVEDGDETLQWLRDGDRVGEGAEIEESSVKCSANNDTMFVSCKFRRPGFARQIGDIYVFDGTLFKAGLQGRLFELEERKYDIRFDVPKVLRTEIRVALPEGFRVEAGTPKSELSDDFVDYVLSGSLSADRIELTRMLKLKHSEIPNEHYPKMRELFKQIDEDDAIKVVLKKTQ